MSTAAKKAPVMSEVFSVGQILVALWGYDQAEADFYEVTRLTARRVELRQLHTERGLETRTPIPGSYASEPKLYGLLAGSADGVKINEHLAAFPWDGNPADILTR